MKKILMVLVLFVMAFAMPVSATNPTVTVTKTDRGKYLVYTISYSTAQTNRDTAFVYAENGGFFGIAGLGAHTSDSLYTAEMYSSEATADSVRHALYWQVTSKASPTTTAGSLAGWITVQVDSAVTQLNNPTYASADGCFGLAKFAKMRKAGLADKMRLMVTEIGTVAKDANQTVTILLLVSKR